MACVAARVLDVGTDHGYLPIALVKAGRAERVIAGDVNAEPIRNAQKSVAAEHADIASKIEVHFWPVWLSVPHFFACAVCASRSQYRALVCCLNVLLSGVIGIAIAKISTCNIEFEPRGVLLPSLRGRLLLSCMRTSDPAGRWAGSAARSRRS
jgi:ribosomal protein L11 methylase PrmA